ncbi:MAG: L,D-transpeptidase family protein [Acidimicrobiales bacterium]
MRGRMSPRHRGHSGYRWWLVLAAAVVVIGAGAAIVLGQTSRPTSATRGSGPSTTVGAGSGSSGPRRALRLEHMTPADGTRAALGTAPLVLSFSTALSVHTPNPAVSPSVAGSWKVSGTADVFTPALPWFPLTPVTVTVPAGSGGMLASDGSRLGQALREHFQIVSASITRLQQLFSLLAYSPLSWRPAGAAISPSDTAAQLRALYYPPPGTFVWSQGGWPSQLTSLWKPGSFNVMTRGLVMEFQADHGLSVNGALTPGLFVAMLHALGAHETNSGGYNFALGDKALPEQLIIWHDGHIVLRTPANTGIPQSPTPDGVFPVYARYRNEIMRGTNPGGSTYADPVQFVAYFHQGDAVHYLPRTDYGIPQSLGCIELPLQSASEAWPWLAYGTLVDVIS